MNPHRAPAFSRDPPRELQAWRGPQNSRKHGGFRDIARPPAPPVSQPSSNVAGYSDPASSMARWNGANRRGPPPAPPGPPPCGPPSAWGPLENCQNTRPGPLPWGMRSDFNYEAAGNRRGRRGGPGVPGPPSDHCSIPCPPQRFWEGPQDPPCDRHSIRPGGPRVCGGRDGPLGTQPPPPISGGGNSWGGPRDDRRFRDAEYTMAAGDPPPWGPPLAYDSAQQVMGKGPAERGPGPIDVPRPSHGGHLPPLQSEEPRFGRLLHEGGPPDTYCSTSAGPLVPRGGPVSGLRKSEYPPSTEECHNSSRNISNSRDDCSIPVGPHSFPPGSDMEKGNYYVRPNQLPVGGPDNTTDRRAPGALPGAASSLWNSRAAAEAAAAEAAAAAVSRCIANGTLPRQPLPFPVCVPSVDRAREGAPGAQEGLPSLVPGASPGPLQGLTAQLREAPPCGAPPSGPQRGPPGPPAGAGGGAGFGGPQGRGHMGPFQGLPFPDFVFDPSRQHNSAPFSSLPQQQQQQQKEQQQHQQMQPLTPQGDGLLSSLLSHEGAMQLLLLAAQQQQQPQQPQQPQNQAAGMHLPGAGLPAVAAGQQQDQQQRAVSEALLQGLAMGAQLQLQQHQAGGSGPANSLFTQGCPQQQLILLESLRSAAAAAAAAIRSNPDVGSASQPAQAALVQLQQLLQQQQQNAGASPAHLTLQHTIQSSAATALQQQQQSRQEQEQLQQPRKESSPQKQRQVSQSVPSTHHQAHEGPATLRQQCLVAAVKLQPPHPATSPDDAQTSSARSSHVGNQQHQQQEQQQQQQQQGYGRTKMSLLDELSAVPERLLDPQENEAAHTWCYLDAFNKACLAPLTLSLVSVFFKNCGSHVTDSPCQGPFSTLTMLRWLELGYFDPTRPLRRDDEKGFTPLHDGSRIKRAAKDIVLSARSHRSRAAADTVEYERPALSLQAKVQSAQAALAPLYVLAKKDRARPGTPANRSEKKRKM
ncbi:hypothetical protein, conserved [Eimeria tenella]|uniref:GYF domain-containing protein n=1 Tax=Eimeria tenella TaxID=5802 RepID=U6KLF3_EIMTE|nr:hypothetical protein, conserved [Eimeria tenella]CDJ38907.1 hypothetical protein, conserved [Eimeria tenella]|eukprot:XP_013229662.1 hypothetical protein, conserved [Eimeria tenella]